MLRYFYQISVLAGLIFTLNSCQQMNENEPKQFEVEVDEVVNIIAENFLTINIFGGDEERAFSSGRILGYEDSNMNIPSEDENPKPLTACIRGLKLEQNQLHDISRLLFIFDNCKSDVIHSFREEIRKTIATMEVQRTVLLEQLQNGEISREEFKIKVEELRNRYSSVVEEIKNTHKEALIPCLKRFVTGLQMALGRDNWLSFRKCVLNT